MAKNKKNKKDKSEEVVTLFHAADSTLIMGVVEGEQGGTFVVKNPLLVKRHPTIEGVYLSRYNAFNTSKDTTVRLNPAGLIGWYECEESVKEFYDRFAELVPEETVEYQVVGPNSAISETSRTETDTVVDIKELRKTTDRLKD